MNTDNEFFGISKNVPTEKEISIIAEKVAKHVAEAVERYKKS